MVAPFYASATGAALRVADYQAVGTAGADAVMTLSSPLSKVVTDELDGARAVLGLQTEELLLAALAGAIARTLGDGVVKVDVAADGDAVYPIALRCEADLGDRATEILGTVHRAVVTASLLGVNGARADAEIGFAYGGTASGNDRELGHALELVAYHLDGLLELDWRYDARKFDAYTVEEFAEQFPLALIALTSEAVPPVDVVVEGQSRIFVAK